VAWACWLYTALALTAWLLLATAVDTWWPATLLMYGPRWVLLLPLAALSPAAIWLRPRLLGLLLVAALVVVWPVMDLHLSPGAVFEGDEVLPSVRVLTCNVHRNQLNPGALEKFIEETHPDIVALQDWSSRSQKELFGQPGWRHLRRSDELCLYSRFPIRDVECLDAPEFQKGLGTVCLFALDTPQGRVWFVNVHLASPRSGLAAILSRRAETIAKMQANIDLRRRQSALATARVAELSGPCLVAGDFNTTTESVIFRDDWSGFTDAFSAAGHGWGWTFLTSRCGTRIDHVLGGPGWHCRRCWVGPNVGSSHRPLVADMEWVQKDD
jgi:endonuclease/exonuclease/phosphatase (EEP) superfamily protein YafD